MAIPTSLPARIGYQVLANLRADATLAAAFPTIEAYQHAEIPELHFGGAGLPVLGVILDSVRLTFERMQLMETRLLLVTIERPVNRTVEDVWAKTDRVWHIMNVLFAERGVIRDPEDADAQITQALERYEVGQLAGSLPRDKNLLVTPIYVTFTSDYRQSLELIT